MKKSIELAKECYFEVATALVEKKRKKEIRKIVENFIAKNNITFEDLIKEINELYYRRNEAKNPLPKIKEVHDILTAIKKDMHFEKKEQEKEELHRNKKRQRQILTNSINASESLSNGIQTPEETARIIANNKCHDMYQKYFEALLNAYNRLMPVDMALDEVANETGLTVEDIKKYGELYAINYANNSEKNNYRIKLEKLQKTLQNPDTDFLAKACVYKITKVLNNTLDNKEQKIRDILSLQDSKVLNRTRTLIIRYYDGTLNGINNNETRNILFNEEQTIISIIEELTRKPKQKIQNVNSTPAQIKRLETLIEFLNSGMTIEDFCVSPLNKYFSKATPGMMQRILKETSILNNRLEEYLNYSKKIVEYEMSYLQTIIDDIMYYLKNGISYTWEDETKKRNFTIFDYYGMTNYPLDKLKRKVAQYNLLNRDDAVLFMTFVAQNSSKGKVVLYIDLNRILNDLEDKRQFGSEFRSLTREEKVSLYYLLKDYNIPMTFENFNEAVNEYANGRLFLARR